MQAVLRVKLRLNLAVLGVPGLWASGCAGIKSRVLLEAWLRGMVSGTASLGLLLWKMLWGASKEVKWSNLALGRALNTG